MKNFKDFELTNEQQANTIGKGKPAWAGTKASKRNGDSYGGNDWVLGADDEYINPDAKPEEEEEIEVEELDD